jgi:hypothetical protein
MNILNHFFKKKQQPSVTVTTLPKTPTENPADTINRNFGFALSYAANMQGITLDNEQLSTILETVRRVVGVTDSTTEETVQQLPEKTKDSKTNIFKSNFEKFEAYIKLRYTLRINTLLGYTEIAERKEVESEQVYYPVTDYETGSIIQDLQCEGINMWKCDVDRYMNSDKVQKYHPFLQYFERLPKWDGKDRVTDLAERVSTKSAWVRGFHRWMLAVTAQWMGYARQTHSACNARANSVAPILISGHQGWGKSTFCRMLLPEELQPFYTDSFNIAQPTACEAKLAEFGLINLDEFDRIPSGRNAQLKNLMQMTALHVRKAYKRNAKNCFRLASFIGTSNNYELLTDKSGSRRFLCIELQHAIDCETPIEYEQLYAQLKHEILAGERYWFSEEEEAEVQENNQTFYRTTPLEELFHRVYREVDSKTEGVLKIGSLDIFNELKRNFPLEMAGIRSSDVARALPGFAKRVHIKGGNIYYLMRR